MFLPGRPSPGSRLFRVDTILYEGPGHRLQRSDRHGVVPSPSCADGHEIIRAMRVESRNHANRAAGATAAGGERLVEWDIRRGFANPVELEGLGAAVHLAGESVSGLWTAQKRRRIYDSRVKGAQTLCEALSTLQSRPEVLVVASAVGYYGSRGIHVVDEDSPQGEGFLAEVAADTEAATGAARWAGIRVAAARLGIVFSPRGGAMAKMLPIFHAGLGGRLGNGRQFWSWISLEDAVGALRFIIRNRGMGGPVNVVTPNPVTNAQFTHALGSVLSRPTLLTMPALALRLAMGRMADEVLLSSVRAVPRRLCESGYHFTHGQLEPALRAMLLPAEVTVGGSAGEE